MAGQVIIDDLIQFRCTALRLVGITEAERDALVIPGGEYWMVYVIGSGRQTWNGTFWEVTEGTPAIPGQVTGLSLVAVSTSHIDLTWNPVPGATYEVEDSTNGTDFTPLDTATDPDYSHTGLDPGTRHYYRVRAVNDGGNGTYSATANTYTLPDVPVNIAALPNDVGRIDVTVDAVTSATSYNLYGADSSGGTYSLVDSQAAPALSEMGLGNDQVRFYKVTAVNPGGEGGFSGVDSAQTNPAPSSLFDGLEVAYQLDDVNDSFGTLHLTNNNSVTFGAGSVGNAASFTAASSMYLSHVDDSALRFGGVRDFTLACRVKAATFGADRSIIAKATSLSNLELFLDYSNALNRFRIILIDGGTHQLVASSFGAPSTGVWYPIIVRYDRANLKIRVNAIENTVGLTATINAGTAPFLIGAAGAVPAAFWNGQIDEVYKWNRALTDAECLAYEAGPAYPF